MNVTERMLAKLEACAPYYARVLELRERLDDPDDWVAWSAFERNLQLAIECAIDVGQMLIARDALPRPEENKDVFLVLRDAGVVPPELAERLARAAGLRNLLVHRYGELDPEELKRVAFRDVEDLDAFARRVAQHVGVPK